MLNIKSAGRPRIGKHEMFYVEPINYYICGTTGSGKTLLVKKWLEKLSKKNENRSLYKKMCRIMGNI